MAKQEEWERKIANFEARTKSEREERRRQVRMKYKDKFARIIERIQSKEKYRRERLAQLEIEKRERADKCIAKNEKYRSKVVNAKKVSEQLKREKVKEMRDDLEKEAMERLEEFNMKRRVVEEKLEQLEMARQKAVEDRREAEVGRLRRKNIEKEAKRQSSLADDMAREERRVEMVREAQRELQHQKKVAAEERNLEIMKTHKQHRKLLKLKQKELQDKMVKKEGILNTFKVKKELREYALRSIATIDKLYKDTLLEIEYEIRVKKVVDHHVKQKLLLAEKVKEASLESLKVTLSNFSSSGGKLIPNVSGGLQIPIPPPPSSAPLMSQSSVRGGGSATSGGGLGKSSGSNSLFSTAKQGATPQQNHRTVRAATAPTSSKGPGRNVDPASTTSRGPNSPSNPPRTTNSTPLLPGEKKPKKVHCAQCEMTFYPESLGGVTTIKAVIDLRKHWGYGEQDIVKKWPQCSTKFYKCRPTALYDKCAVCLMCYQYLLTEYRL